MKVLAIFGCTVLMAAVCFALPEAQPLSHDVDSLWEQETALYERVSSPSLYRQQSDLFESLVEVEQSKKAAKKPAAKKPKAKAKGKKAVKDVSDEELDKQEKHTFHEHAKEVVKADQRHADEALKESEVHTAEMKAKAKETKKQEHKIVAAMKAQEKQETTENKAADKAAKSAAAHTKATEKKEIEATYKIYNPKGAKGLAQQKKNAQFVKKEEAAAQGKAVITSGDKIYIKGVGNPPAYTGKGKGKGKGKKIAAHKKKAAKKKAAKGKKKDMYEQEAELFESMINEPTRTPERKALDRMHEAEALAQAKSTAMFEQALKTDAPMDPLDELMQFDTIVPLSEQEEQRGAQKVRYAAEEELYEDMTAPRHTSEQKAIAAMKDSEEEALAVSTQLFQEAAQPLRTPEQKAVEDMKFSEDVLQDEMTRLYNNVL